MPAMVTATPWFRERRSMAREGGVISEQWAVSSGRTGEVVPTEVSGPLAGVDGRSCKLLLHRAMGWGPVVEPVRERSVARRSVADMGPSGE